MWSGFDPVGVQCWQQGLVKHEVKVVYESLGSEKRIRITCILF